MRMPPSGGRAVLRRDALLAGALLTGALMGALLTGLLLTGALLTGMLLTGALTGALLTGMLLMGTPLLAGGATEEPCGAEAAGSAGAAESCAFGTGTVDMGAAWYSKRETPPSGGPHAPHAVIPSCD